MGKDDDKYNGNWSEAKQLVLHRLTELEKFVTEWRAAQKELALQLYKVAEFQSSLKDMGEALENLEDRMEAIKKETKKVVLSKADINLSYKQFLTIIIIVAVISGGSKTLVELLSIIP